MTTLQQLQSFLLSARYEEILSQSSEVTLPADSLALVQYYQAIAYARLGQYGESLESCHRCISALKRTKTHESFLPAFVTLEMASVYNNLGSYDAAITASNRSFRLFTQLNDAIGCSRALYNKGTAELCMNEFVQCSNTLAEAVESSDRSDLANQIRALLNLAGAQRSLGQVEEVLALHVRIQGLLDSCDVINNDAGRIVTEGMIVQTPLGYRRVAYTTTSYRSVGCLTLSTMLASVGLYMKANEYLAKGLELARASDNVPLIASYENNIAHNFLEIQQAVAARPHLDNARACLDRVPDPHVEASIDFNTAKYWVLLHEQKLAMTFFAKAVSAFRRTGDDLSRAQVLLFIARLQRAGKRYDAASKALREAMSLTDDMKLPETKIMQRIEEGAIAIGRGDKHGIELLQRALTMAEKHEYLTEQLRACTLLARACAEYGYAKRSLSYYAKALGLQESEYSTVSSQQLRYLSIVHATEVIKKEKDALSVQHALVLQEKEHVQNRLTMNNKSMLIQLEELTNFRNDVLGITKQLDKAENILRKVKLKLNEAPVMQSSWEHYLETFRAVHPDFERKLLERYPTMTKMEVKICTLARAGLDTPKIAQLLFLSERNIENHRLRIRKKMNLKRQESIPSALAALVA